ncbi:MAG: peptide chain release factor 2 [Anaerovoracaceae bacterium]
MILIEQIKNDLPGLKANLAEVGESLDPALLKTEIEKLNEEMTFDGFWDDHESAQKLLKNKKVLEDKLKEYVELEQRLEDLEVLIEMAIDEKDDSLKSEIEAMRDTFVEDYETVRIKTLLDGEFDQNNAILNVHAGSGGTDAQDWADILLRMYLRWGERKGYGVKVLYLQEDTEGGIKAATVLIEGDNAYGYLKNEKGVHRLVRISPFDSSGRRHTSFASVEVMPEIEEDVTVEIDDDDIRIDTFRASGAGGQHVNKTDSAIRITHLPTNIVVSCQNERSQHQNKDTAMKILMSKLIELKEQEHKENLNELKGDYSQITWGSQIRSYVFHPYTMVKDHRTSAEVGTVDKVLDGDLDYFINAKLKQKD